MITMEDKIVKDNIKINDINIHYKLQGLENEKTIVFIHGLSDDLNYWSKLEYNFSKEYKTLSYDLRGHGKSDLANNEVSVELITSDIMKLLEKLDIDKFNLIGFSLGGSIAINIAEKYPERVNKLVLLSTFAKADSTIENYFKEFNNCLNKSFSEYYDYILEYVLPEDLIEKHQESLEEIKVAKSKTVCCENLIKVLPVGLKFDGEKDLDKITALTLIISSKHDELTKTELSHTKVREKEIENNVDVIIKDHIIDTFNEYLYATRQFDGLN